MQRIFPLLFFFLILPGFATAAPVLEDSPEIQKALELRIPEVYGKVFSRHKAEPFAAPFIILIQDEHKSLESQLKIAELLNYLGITLGTQQIFTEGSEGPIDVRIASTFPVEAAREAVLKNYVREGKVSGAEYEVIAHNSEQTLFGIERQADYRYQYEAFFDCLLFQMSHQKELLYVEEILRRAKYFDLLSDELLLLDEWKTDYREGSLPVEDLINQILPLVDKYAIQLGGYPELELFQQGKDWYDRNVLYQECARLITAIESRIASHMKDYILVAAANGYSLMRSIIELKSSTSAALEFFQKPDDQKMTWEKIDEIFRLRYPDQTPIDVTLLNQMLAKAKVFYDYGKRREQVMAALMLREARAQDLQTALCVVGRHHTRGISEALTREGISHYVITPNVNSFEQTIPYEVQMLGKKSGMEAFFAAGSRHLRMPSAFKPILEKDNTAFLDGLVTELYLAGFQEEVVSRVSQDSLLAKSFQDYEAKLQEWDWQGLSRLQELLNMGPCLNAAPWFVFPKASLDGKEIILFFATSSADPGRTKKILKNMTAVVPPVYFAEDGADRKIEKRLKRSGLKIKEEEFLAVNRKDHADQQSDIEKQVQEDLELNTQEMLQ